MSLHTGTIKRGTGRAGKLGFPTINIDLKDTLRPGSPRPCSGQAGQENISGIYAARVVIDGVSYNSAAYADRRRNLLEAHLLDFSGEIYGLEASIELLQKISDDKFFDSDTMLSAKIADDVKKAREYFKSQS